jgi:hypothetical protein
VDDDPLQVCNKALADKDKEIERLRELSTKHKAEVDRLREENERLKQPDFFGFDEGGEG